MSSLSRPRAHLGHGRSKDLLGPSTVRVPLAVLARTLAGTAEALNLLGRGADDERLVRERITYVSDTLGSLGLALAKAYQDRSDVEISTPPSLLLRLARILSDAANAARLESRDTGRPGATELAVAFRRNAQALRIFAQVNRT